MVFLRNSSFTQAANSLYSPANEDCHYCSAIEGHTRRYRGVCKQDPEGSGTVCVLVIG